MTTRPPIPGLTADEFDRLGMAEQMLHLRGNKAFNRVLGVLNASIDVAREAIERNGDSRKDCALNIAYRERLAMRNAILNYMQAVIAKRREAVSELLRSLGFDDDAIERNQDLSLDFLRMEASYGRNPNTPEPEPEPTGTGTDTYAT